MPKATLYLLILFVSLLTGCKEQATESQQLPGLDKRFDVAAKSLAKDPKNVYALEDLAVQDTMAKRYDKAEEKLRKLIAINATTDDSGKDPQLKISNDKNARMRLARVLGLQGKKEEAIAIYSTFTNDPDFSEAATSSIAKLNKYGKLTVKTQSKK